MALFYKKTFSFFAPRRSIGIHIDDRSVTFTELKKGKKGVSLGVFGRVAVQNCVISNGEILNSKKLEETLSSVRKQVRTKFVNVSFPGEHVYFFKTRLPKIYPIKDSGRWRLRNIFNGARKRNLDKAIEAKVDEQVPDLKKVAFDYTIIRKDKNGYEIQVYVMSKVLINSYLEVFRKAGFVPLSFEVDTRALTRAVFSQSIQGIHIVVDLSDNKTRFIITEEGVPIFSSSSNANNSFLNKKFHKNFSLKRNMENKKIACVLFDNASKLADEIKKIYIDWHIAKDEKGRDREKIKKIILCGSESCLPGLVDYLNMTLRSDIELADVWENINPSDNYIPEMQFNDSLYYATALGLALDGLKK